ncbi:FtsB family cell division protein [Moraxella pluranimalium]|uniref:Uncharacterized protein n=1 Tax=Moraxella pluranimalium TaxID=470453 RepID=A0A1T0CKV9_9GAMM|nr:hypothetical protein [Moraxella pluranimalium]OOS22933.1 hypothetical protein B0680_08950 [Moraxella pluranimalium]
MGFFDELIKQKDGEYIPVWQWVNELAISHDSDIQAVITHLQTTYKDLTVYRRDEKAVYTPKRKTGLSVYDERTIFENTLDTLQSYIDSFTGELNVYKLEHDTASNPTYTDYLKKSELPTFGEQSPSMAGVNDSNSPMNAGEIIAGLQTRILDLQRQLNATTANDDSQQQIADLQAENAKLKARIAKLESELNQQANATPAINHTNTALQALHDVLVTHWQDYDPTNETTKPKQEYIERWIMENYPELNQSKARWIDKIIRHGTHD